MSKAFTLLHTFVHRKGEPTKFKVYQDTGFDAEGKRSHQINEWNASLFETADSLFMEKWNSLGGVVLDVANDYDDKPLVFQKENGEVIGLSVKVLNAIAKQMNFTYLTQVRSSDGKFHISSATSLYCFSL